MRHETYFNEEKQMTLETDASQLTNLFQYFNPNVDLEACKKLMAAPKAVRVKVVNSYDFGTSEKAIMRLLNLTISDLRYKK